MSAVSCIPNELWLEVFRLATCCPEAYAVTYKPFCTDTQTTCEDTAPIGYNLSLVCRLWYALVSEFLYKDIRIGHGQSTLKGALCDRQGFSRFVRRAVLPFQYTNTPSWSAVPLPSVEILKLCNQLEVLIRPLSPPLSGTAPQYQFDTECISLPSLKRLEWNYNPEAEQSGGINSLEATLQNAPNLHYLTIGNVPPHSPIMSLREISLPFLETLTISPLNGFLMNQLAYRWFLPSLRHLVLAAVAISNIVPLCEKYGKQLRSLELGEDRSILLSDVLSSAVANCPHLEELNYYVFWSLPPAIHESPTSIQTVGLHAAPNTMFSSDGAWLLIERHFAFLNSLPSLRTVHLFGDWRQILADIRFTPIYMKLRERGCEVVL